jgi:hypothetical protein
MTSLVTFLTRHAGIAGTVESSLLGKTMVRLESEELGR